jgi:hypothetical protein
MKTLFTILAIGKTYAIYSIQLINDILTKTNHDVFISTDCPEYFSLNERVIIKHIDLDKDKNKKNNSFNYNLKYYCFENLPEKYDIIIYLDCDTKLTLWNDINFENYINFQWDRGYNFIGTRINANLNYHLFNHEKTGIDLFSHKIEAYEIKSDTINKNWLDAGMPSEHYFIMKYNKEQMDIFCKTWKNFNKIMQDKNNETTWGDAFEIGISAREAGYVLSSANCAGIDNSFEIEFNGNKKMCVKLSCNWCNSDELKNRLLSQFDVKKTSLKFVDKDYHMIVYFNYINETPELNKSAIIFPQEPTWSGNHQKTFNGIPNLTIYGYDINKYTFDCKFKESPAYMFYGGRGEKEWTHELNMMNFDKTKAICSTVSIVGLNYESYAEGCLYPMRIQLIQSLLHLPFIDFYGGWVKQEIDNKLDIIKPYKFCLTIENSNENNYVSEKFYDCILTNTIPIYFGCKNIKNLWPENGYILLENISTSYVSEQLTYIYENYDEIYNNLIPELLKMKERYFQEFNLLKIIEKEIYV